MGYLLKKSKRKSIAGPVACCDYYVIPQGRIAEADSKARKGGIWEAFEGRRYITCLGCGTINDISRHPVNLRGFLIEVGGTSLGCVVCQSCDTHFFVKLEGWAPAENKGR